MSRDGVDMIERGLRHLLAHTEVIDAAQGRASPPSGMRLWEVASRDLRWRPSRDFSSR